MKGLFKWQKHLIYLVCLVSGMFHPNIGGILYAAKAEKNVLFISSYTESFATVPQQIEGIRSVFDDEAVKLDIEYMDTKRLDTNTNRELFYQLLKNKLENLEPYDAILLGDDNALQFALDHRSTLFKELPIIFFGINDFDRAILARENENITGITESISLKENIEVAKEFNKDATRVVAIVDDTLTGEGDSQHFYSLKDDFKELSFEEINVSHYTFDEFEKLLQNIENDTILLYLNMFQDKTGKVITLEETFKILKENTNVPIYRASVGGIGEGLLGGKMVSYFEQGKMAADMVMSVFRGVPIESIEMVSESANKYIFDYEIIEKYNIDKNLIPKDAIIINRKSTFFEQYREIVIITFCIGLVLIMIIMIMMIDNLKRRRIEKALQDSHEELTDRYDQIQIYAEKLEGLQKKYEIAIKGTNCAVWEINLKDKKVYFSKEVTNIIDGNLQEQEDVSDIVKEFVILEDQKLLKKAYEAVIRGEEEELYSQVRIRDSKDNFKWLLVSGKGILDFKGVLRFINGIVLDITKIKEQEAYIEHLAYHDSLTGLPNKIDFMNKLEQELALEKKGVVMLIDLDNFKEINDVLGHVYGDDVLQEVAKRLQAIANEKIFISRFGGDEFLILIRDQEDPRLIEEYAEKISRVLKKVFIIKKQEVYINYSMGITLYPCDSKEADQLIMNADTAMFSVKSLGKNSYMFFENNMIEKLREKTNIEAILREALKNEGFILLYQPQVQVMTGEIVGFEALVRLKEHNIPPSLFIPIAEETGLIIALGNWITKEAISQMAKWRAKGLTIKPIAINFSTRQLKDEGYFSFLEEMLQKYHVEPKYLEIEITEGLLVEKTEETISFLNKLRHKGIKIALDDFGTGYSSFSYLTFVPVDKIKLDKSLSDRFLEMENEKVMHSIISLVHSLNLKVTAEGIEKIEQYKRLRMAGCDYIQGYIFSRPLKVEEVEKIYDDNFVDRDNTGLIRHC